MIPIRDTISSRHYPLVNTAIIAINVYVYFAIQPRGMDAEDFAFIYGLVPARYSTPGVWDNVGLGVQLLPFVSFMFLHGGFWHLLGNMWSLYIFGDNVEDRLGHFRYIVFYLACGLASGFTHMYFNWHSEYPAIGASGAVAGVMGAYFLLYPKSRVLTLIPIIIIPYFVEIPAVLFLGLWFLLQFWGAAGDTGGGAGIAWWAHVGGFVAGMFLLVLAPRVPQAGVSRRIEAATRKNGTHRLQMVRPRTINGDPDVYGEIALSRHEALYGATKTVGIPAGLRQRMVTVPVPPGVTDGSFLKVAGLGNAKQDGTRGDLYLRVHIY